MVVGIRGFVPFPEVNVTTQLGFDLPYNEVTVQYVNHCATGFPSGCDEPTEFRAS